MIAITDYGAGNIASVRNALARLGRECVVTADADEIASADGVICPGQGRAGAAMGRLRESGLDALIPRLERPFLGICVGMQLLGAYSEEDGQQCLGVFPGTSRKFPDNLKAPHLGWNRVEIERESALTEGIDSGSYFYFVHSYYLDTGGDGAAGTTSYGVRFASIMLKDRFHAVQFHPEKSGDVGLRLLDNFCRLCL